MSKLKDKEQERAGIVLSILRRNFSVPRSVQAADDPFKVLVRTIISQSTVEANTRRAYQNLSSRLPVTPDGLAKAKLEELEEALKTAGLFRNKARVIKEVSELILHRFNGSLDFVYSLPLAEARRSLMDLPGVGPKTADIVLLFCAKKPVLPVDTHVNRVAKRLGFVDQKARYEEVRGRLEELFAAESYLDVHMLFIALGRTHCGALKPSHASCPVTGLCPSSES